jgi:hypothetical protein
VEFIKITMPCMMRWAGHAARIEDRRNAYRLLVRKPEGKGPLRRPRRRWVDNIRMDLGEMGWGGVDWFGLAQNRDKWRALVNAVMKPLVASRVVLRSIEGEMPCKM